MSSDKRVRELERLIVEITEALFPNAQTLIVHGKDLPRHVGQARAQRDRYRHLLGQVDELAEGLAERAAQAEAAGRQDVAQELSDAARELAGLVQPVVKP